MRCRKLRNRGQSPCGPTAVTLVRWSSCLCGRSLLVRRSITPSGVLSSHGSASHCPTVAANRRSTVARYKTAETVLALPTRSEARFSHSVAASSQRMRARPAAFRVSSCFHRVPSQTIHRPHLSTKRRSPACRPTKRRASAASEKGDVPSDDCLRGSNRRSLTAPVVCSGLKARGSAGLFSGNVVTAHSQYLPAARPAPRRAWASDSGSRRRSRRSPAARSASRYRMFPKATSCWRGLPRGLAGSGFALGESSFGRPRQQRLQSVNRDKARATELYAGKPAALDPFINQGARDAVNARGVFRAKRSALDRRLRLSIHFWTALLETVPISTPNFQAVINRKALQLANRTRFA